jgi:hypothetical protein
LITYVINEEKKKKNSGQCQRRSLAAAKALTSSITGCHIYL